MSIGYEIEKCGEGFPTLKFKFYADDITTIVTFDDLCIIKKDVTRFQEKLKNNEIGCLIFCQCNGFVGISAGKKKISFSVSNRNPQGYGDVCVNVPRKANYEQEICDILTKLLDEM
uniref:Uncharacterized protein n=1 Tax=Pithovirus LCDPAC01 TaxID=2506600 RepID=A0A4D5XF82_9VIRU|nr:MAG: uncharacterized protein LCDPAC01_02540 [Pithovirus LCDPAC01]